MSKLWDEDDKNKIITHVRVEGEKITTVLSICKRITSGENFYVLVDDKKIDVVTRIDNQKKFITTSQDGISPNELYSLPKCEGFDFG